MKHSLLFLPVAALVSCASVPPPTDSELASRVQAYLGGPSQPAAVELNVEPDYLGERVTLVRTIFVRPASNGISEIKRPYDDVPMGVALGNGLYLDANNNLSIRVDRLAGVGPTYQGTTEYWAQTPGQPGTGLVAEFSDERIDVTTPGVFGGKYKLETGGDSLLVLGAWLKTTDDGYQLLSLTPISLEKSKKGVRKTWYAGVGLSLGGPDSFELLAGDNRVADRSKTFVVERRDDYVHVGYNLDKIRQSFRLYRNDKSTVVVNEADGAMVVFRFTDDGLEWQRVPAGAPAGEFHAQGRLTRSAS